MQQNDHARAPKQLTMTTTTLSTLNIASPKKIGSPFRFFCRGGAAVHRLLLRVKQNKIKEPLSHALFKLSLSLLKFASFTLLFWSYFTVIAICFVRQFAVYYVHNFFYFLLRFLVPHLGPVSRKPRKVFGPLKPFLDHLYLKTEKCKGLKLLV